MKKVFSFIALFVLVCSLVYAAGNKNDLAYFGYDELQTVTGLTTADEIIVIESNIPKKSVTVANVLALASPSDVESASGDFTATRDLIATRNLAAVAGNFTGAATADTVTATTTLIATAALTVGTTGTFTGNVVANGDIVGDGGGEIRGMLADFEVAGGADTLTVAESGRTFIETAVVEKELPTAAAGIEYKIKAGLNVAISVDPPPTADTIMAGGVILDAGDKITTSGATGDTIDLIGNTNIWYAVCYPNACTDGGA